MHTGELERHHMNLKIYFLLLCLPSCFIATYAQAPQPAAANTYALVVGISGYQDAAIPKLNYADKDASLFAQWLQSKAGGSVPGYQIKLLTNETASIAAVYSALDWLKEIATAGDTVFIYFSGHGDIETKDSISQGYLLAWNSPPNNYRNNAIGVADLNNIANILTTSNRANVIIITDACHSGKMAGDFYKGRELTAANLRLVLNNQVRMASCQANEEAAEGPYWGGGRGVFSYYLLMGLNGKAGNNGQVRLQDLQVFLNNAFAEDKYLKLDNHQQHPVSDGSPIFPVAEIDSATLQALSRAENNNAFAQPATTAGLQSLKTIGRQPIDYFFEIARGSVLDSVLTFEKYASIDPDKVPGQILNDYVAYLDDLINKSDSLQKVDSIYQVLLNKNSGLSDSLSPLMDINNAVINKYHDQFYSIELDSLRMFQKQLHNNKFIRNRFIEKFVQLTHQKSQDMINAYLKGDLDELEKRQYYYAGNRDYRNFLPVMNTAIHLAPVSNYLHDILKINQAYIAGLVDRLDITTHKKQADSLLNAALAQQHRALSLEPYAAYIHNELGNLFLQKRNYNSAAYHYDYALLLSPTWAIPWSNKIRMNFAQGNLSKAKEAIKKADSLQPNLAYVNVNAGLVMEKDNNLLAAEGYYLSAIAQNNVHYLPYERLGKIYILTGEYEKADSFLYEAKKRKDDFAVNESVFDFGIELGGQEEGKNEEKFMYDCGTAKDSLTPGWGTYNMLVHALLNLQYPTNFPGDGKQMAKDVIKRIPGILLADHYLGKKYFEEGNWQLAEQALKQAKGNYLPEEELRATLKAILRDSLLVAKAEMQNDKKNFSALVDRSCLLARLMNFRYDVLEDNYLLANIYERKGFVDEAIKEYKIIASLENIRQQEQAVFKDYGIYEAVFDFTKPFNGTEQQYERLMMDRGSLVAKYNNPIRMGGSLKAAAQYEQSGRYELAEEILLKQVALNRQAGYARQEEMNKENFGPTGQSPINYYWLDVNRDLEGATYNFYSRMLAQFPRDAYWHKQAGMFLYNRLLLTYEQIPVAERSTFYKYSLDYAYPFEGSLQPPNEGYDYDSVYRIVHTKSKLPGTGELLVVDLLTYDPVQHAQTYLQNAIRFTGEANPNPVVQEALADLQSWMGNNNEAIDNYAYLVQQQSGNATLRNKLIDLLLITKKFPAAATQLDSLFSHGQARRNQLLQ